MVNNQQVISAPLKFIRKNFNDEILPKKLLDVRIIILIKIYYY